MPMLASWHRFAVPIRLGHFVEAVDQFHARWSSRSGRKTDQADIDQYACPSYFKWGLSARAKRQRKRMKMHLLQGIRAERGDLLLGQRWQSGDEAWSEEETPPLVIENTSETIAGA